MKKCLPILSLLFISLTSHAGYLAFQNEENHYDRKDKLIGAILTKTETDTNIVLTLKTGSCIIPTKSTAEALTLMSLAKDDQVTIICYNPTNQMNVIALRYQVEFEQK